MKNDCEKLEKKYEQLVNMLRESFQILKEEIENFSSEKRKKNNLIMAYKKRVSEELQKLKKILKSQEEIVEFYKKQNLALRKENLLLKNKFKKTAAMFSEKKENDLLFKYFKDEIKIEEFLEKVVNKAMNEKFNPKIATPLYFRKEFKNVFKFYLIKSLVKYTKIEKIAVLVSSIILKKYDKKIYLFVALYLLERINVKEYEEFIQIMLTKKLVDKEKKYEPLEFDYSMDDIKRTINLYKKINIENRDILSKIDLNDLKKQLDDKKIELENSKNELEKLENIENDILVKLTKEEDENQKDEIKKSLEKIDVEKRELHSKMESLEKEIERLENRKTFLEPLNEISFKKGMNEKDTKIVENYNILLDNFAISLEKGME